jgi:hypothetical protein
VIPLMQTKRDLTHSLTDCGTAEATIADIAKKWDLKPSVMTAQAR